MLPVIESFTKTTTGAGDVTLTKPDGVSVGDFLVLIPGTDPTADGQGFNELTGWTRSINAGDRTSDGYMAFFWRVADGTEGSTVTVDNITGDDSFGWYLRLSGVDTTDPINVIGSPTTGYYTVMTNTGVTTTEDDCLIFTLFGHDGADHTFTISGNGTKFDSEIVTPFGSGGGASGCFATYAKETAGATGDCVCTMSGGDGGVHIAIAIKGAEADPPASPSMKIFMMV